MWFIIFIEENLNYSILNPEDKLSERKAELLQQRKDSKQELKQL